MSGQPKKDNSTGGAKVNLRRSALREIAEPSILETHGGAGKIFLNCYHGRDRGVVFEKDERKADRLADQRPGWAVYQADCVKCLEAGVGFQFQPNFFDLDPYGECWPVMDAIFAGLPAARPGKLVFVVNDGLRQKLVMNAGWSVGSMAKVVQRHGNDKLYRIYLEVCQELLEEKAAGAGYVLSKWTGYYCGAGKQMTHFAAVLELKQ